MLISVVVPVRNERGSLPELLDRIREVVARERPADTLQCIVVDDGSDDGTWEVLAEIARNDPRVSAVRFRRNFGKAAALACGFERARGERVFTMDGDLQDDPDEIPRFLRAVDDGLDLVSGWKRRRFDPWHKVYPSRVFNAMVSALTGCRLHDHNCGYKLYRAEVARSLKVYGELHRFLPALAHARGFRVGEIEVRHRPRTSGRSKYGLSRFLKGFLDLLWVAFLNRYGLRPMHALGGVGLPLVALGTLALLALLALRIAGIQPGTLETALAAAALQLGTLALLAGLVLEILLNQIVQPPKTFEIAETLEHEQEHEHRPETETPTPTPTPNTRTEQPRSAREPGETETETETAPAR